MKGISQQQTAISQYSYNGLGDRVSQTNNGVTTNYSLDLNAELTQVLSATTNGQQPATSYYLYGLGRIGEQQSSGFAYHLGDALGSVRQLVDSNASVTLTKNYEPYGTVLSSAGIEGSVFGYTGEQVDASGLTFLRARFYNPALGRFLNGDLWGGEVEIPATFNLYAYVTNNPLRYVDPTGHWPWDTWSTEQKAQAASIAANVTISIGVGLITVGVCAATAGVGCIVAGAALGAGGGALGGAVGTMVYNRMTGRDVWENVGQNMLIGGVAGGVGGLVGGTVATGLVTKAAGTAGLSLAESVALGTASGLYGGAASGAAGQLTANTVYGRPLNDNVIEATAVGGVFGGLGGAVGGAVGWLSRQSKLYAGLEPEELWYYGKVRALASLQRLLSRLLSRGLTKYGRMAPAENAALERLAYETGETIRIPGGYGETRGGIQARALARVFGYKVAVPEMNMQSWTNKGVPRGADVDLWAPLSPEAEMGIRRIFGYTGEFDYYIKQLAYHPWVGIDHLPAAMKTYIPGQPMQQTIPPWDVSRWMPSR